MKEKLQYNYDRNIIPNQMNPILSKEEKEEVNFFLKWGYLVIDNALNDDQIKSLREAFNYTFENLTKLDHIEILLPLNVIYYHSFLDFFSSTQDKIK